MSAINVLSGWALLEHRVVKLTDSYWTQQYLQCEGESKKAEITLAINATALASKAVSLLKDLKVPNMYKLSILFLLTFKNTLASFFFG